MLLKDLEVVLRLPDTWQGVELFDLLQRLETRQHHPEERDQHRQSQQNQDDMAGPELPRLPFPAGAFPGAPAFSFCSQLSCIDHFPGYLLVDFFAAELPVDQRDHKDIKKERPGDGGGIADLELLERFGIDIIREGGGRAGGTRPALITRACSNPPCQSPDKLITTR